MAAGDEAELVHMVATCVAIDDRPSAVRFPRGDGIGVPLPEVGVPLEIGRGRIVQRGHQHRAAELRRAPRRMPEGGAGTGRLRAVDDGCRRALRQAARHRSGQPPGARARGRDHDRGRLRSAASARHVLHHLAMTGQLDHGLKIRTMVLPDVFLDHDSPDAQYDAAGLNARHIVATALAALGREIAEQPGAGLSAHDIGARASCRHVRGQRPALPLFILRRRHPGAERAPPAAARPAPASSKSSISSWNRRCQLTLALQVQEHRAEPDRRAVHEHKGARRRDAAQAADVAVHVVDQTAAVGAGLRALLDHPGAVVEQRAVNESAPSGSAPRSSRATDCRSPSSDRPRPPARGRRAAARDRGR